jgi:DNA-binding transcriptional ArsR family regulator
MVEYPANIALDATFGALAHPVRRQILARLRDAPARVTELARPHDLSLNAISKHVKALESAGLVDRRIVGRDHWLTLRPAAMAPAADWLDAYRSFWEQGLDRLDALLEARRRERERT